MKPWGHQQTQDAQDDQLTTESSKGVTISPLEICPYRTNRASQMTKSHDPKSSSRYLRFPKPKCEPYSQTNTQSANTTRIPKFRQQRKLFISPATYCRITLTSLANRFGTTCLVSPLCCSKFPASSALSDDERTPREFQRSDARARKTVMFVVDDDASGLRAGVAARRALRDEVADEGVVGFAPEDAKMPITFG